MLIQIIEEQEKIFPLLREELGDTAHQLCSCRTFARSQSRDGQTGDLIILNSAQPAGTLATTVAELRNLHENALLLCLSSTPGSAQPIAALEAGADMALAQPISEAEILARVRALLRRAGTQRGRLLYYEGLSLDPVEQRAWYREQDLPLSQREYALLEVLMRTPEQVVSKKAILEHVWPEKTCVFSNLVEVFISYLRGKLAQQEAGELIRTVRGAGYMLQRSSATQDKAVSTAA